jgi:hypothetical protein
MRKVFATIKQQKHPILFYLFLATTYILSVVTTM